MTTNSLNLSLGSGGSGEALDVRDFSVIEGMSRPFDIRLTVRSTSTDVDFEAAIGGAARFTVGDHRSWTGVCAEIALERAEPHGLSTYTVHVVPQLWLLGQRCNYRIFQDKSELDIVLEVLSGWGIQPTLALSAGSYKKRRMRTQYAESDLDFVSRLLEDIGVAYFFSEAGLVLADAPNRAEPQVTVPFVDTPVTHMPSAYVTEVATERGLRPGRFTQSDVDYRKALHYPLSASSSRGSAVEARIERYHHDYGSFLWKGAGGDTPVADDRGAARTDLREGGKQVDKRLEALRVDARAVSFRTTAHELAPGSVLRISDHPRREVGAPLLVVASRFEGSVDKAWRQTCEARYTDVDYRPPHRTPKPRTEGVESATVTGPAGEEIHCDEFGRVRVHFHWDREGAADETSSCWVPVSQAWAGAGFGAVSLPRVGQEVLVDFLGADPDRPLVMGRVFTTTTPPPYELPKYKTVSGLRSETYPRPKSGGAARMGGGPVGGGEAVLARGGDEPSPSLGTVEQPSTMPGIFGGTQARPDELAAATTRMRSLGPDSGDPGRTANNVVFDDQHGQQQVYLQAQRDLVMTVKNDLTGSVGANRAFMVHGNDYEEVAAGYQSTTVRLDRTVEVLDGKQVHTVQDDIVVVGEENRYVRIKQDHYAETVEGGQVFASKTAFVMRVQDSVILMMPNTVIIQTGRMFINPGQATVDAILAGQSANTVWSAQEREARIQRAMQAMIDARTFPDEYSLSQTARGAQGTWYTDAANRAGVTDRAEIAEAASRAHTQIYGH
jgi:type VI secretion system secreted protein VgrG